MPRKLELGTQIALVSLLVAMGVLNYISEVSASSPPQARPGSLSSLESLTSVETVEYTPTPELETAGVIAKVTILDLANLTLSVAPQPRNNTGFVTSNEEEFTQSQFAAQNGTFGILAHNYLAGEHILDLKKGYAINLDMVNGPDRQFVVTKISDYQKLLGPSWRGSTFHSLDGKGDDLSAQELFETYFNRPGMLTFQTCLEEDGNSTWGLRFVTATEVNPTLTPPKQPLQ